jgi:hypothetical protein
MLSEMKLLLGKLKNIRLIQMNCSFVFYSKSSDKAPDKYNGKGWSERKNMIGGKNYQTCIPFSPRWTYME